MDENNNKIAKNTVVLYVRMLFLMFVSFYTSRVVLATLGVEDFGLYNVVGGIVTMFTFLSAAMGNSSQRYITFALGKGEKKQLKEIFSLTCMIHWGLAFVILILSETVGLWFLYNKMIIPADRFEVAFWVYQFSVISCMISIISIPYNSLIIAHEKMTIFAVFSSIYALAKLAIVFIIQMTSIDKLLFYSALLLVVQIIDRLNYQIYCKFRFEESRKVRLVKSSYTKEMFNFAGWSILSNFATIGYTQGLNIILNMFFGPIVNAARGVSVQVQGVVVNFVVSFQTAVSPQIIKSYAIGDYSRTTKLVFCSSKLSYYLLLCLSMPIFFQAEKILGLWLKDVPEHSTSFLRLMLLAVLFDPLSNPVCVANNATGKIKTFQIVESCCLLVILPISYIVLKIGALPESVFIVQFFVTMITQFIRVAMVKSKLHFSYKEYFKEIIFRICLVSFVSALPSLFLLYVLDNSFLSSLIICLSSMLSVLVCSYYIGLNEEERTPIHNKIISLIKNESISK